MRMLKRGTKSILFGVHQFIWHPFTVWRAFRYLYGRNPGLSGAICIFAHDLGYWGKNTMDGPDGRTHPEGGARIARRLVYWAARLRGKGKQHARQLATQAFDYCLFHSTHYAQLKNREVSPLYLPDKVCVLFDPPWFYLLRARLSGELKEYVDNDNRKRLAGQKENTSREWLDSYRVRTRHKAEEFFVRQRKIIPIFYVKRGNKMPCECEICIEK